MFDTKLKIRFKVNHRNGGMVHAFRTGSVPCAPPAACGIGGHAGAGPVRVIQAYRFALEPSPAQERDLRSHAGASRFAWNWGLARVRERYAAEGTWYSGIDLHKMWNAAKKADPALAWWSENSKWAYQEAFNDLHRALRDFDKSRKGLRKGKRLGFPKVKKRGKCKDSFRFGTGAIRCVGATVTLPRLGAIRTHESTRKLARRLAAGTARILSATVSRTAQRWFVSFTVEVERAIPERHARPGSAIGVDLGIKTLLTGVDDAGNTISIDGPQALRTSLRKLRRASRAHSRKVKGGANRRKHADRLARIYARVANVRADSLRKATSGLAARYETIVAEDLNVTGMIANRKLARAVADQGFGQARRMLSYKTIWNGGTLLVADRWYPSSKTCSACGWRKPSLKLAERRFACEACGLIIDRDQNAARNLLALRLEAGTDPGTARGAGTGPADRAYACGDHVRPGPAGQWPQPRVSGKKQEPGTAHADQTGTAAG
jgi:putative transposase